MQWHRVDVKLVNGSFYWRSIYCKLNSCDDVSNSVIGWYLSTLCLQTGTGKTHTMIGTEEEPGIIPLVRCP